MSKKISELPETINLQETDILPIVNESETKKVTISSLIDFIKTFFNNVYASISHTHTKADITDFPNMNEYIKEESDPTVPTHVKNIAEEDIDNWNDKYTKTEIDTKIGDVETILETITTGSGV